MLNKMIAVDEEVYKLVTRDCLKELLENHPELLKTQISANKILYHMAHYYLEREIKVK